MGICPESRCLPASDRGTAAAKGAGCALMAALLRMGRQAAAWAEGRHADGLCGRCVEDTFPARGNSARPARLPYVRFSLSSGRFKPARAKGRQAEEARRGAWPEAAQCLLPRSASADYRDAVSSNLTTILHSGVCNAGPYALSIPTLLHHWRAKSWVRCLNLALRWLDQKRRTKRGGPKEADAQSARDGGLLFCVPLTMGVSCSAVRLSAGGPAMGKSRGFSEDGSLHALATGGAGSLFPR
eukprot:350242-Chlamydomonas_euryale.AAC.4